jgi:hypothetical protein
MVAVVQLQCNRAYTDRRLGYREFFKLLELSETGGRGDNPSQVPGAKGAASLRFDEYAQNVSSSGRCEYSAAALHGARLSVERRGQGGGGEVVYGSSVPVDDIQSSYVELFESLEMMETELAPDAVITVCAICVLRIDGPGRQCEEVFGSGKCVERRSRQMVSDTWPCECLDTFGYHVRVPSFETDATRSRRQTCNFFNLPLLSVNGENSSCCPESLFYLSLMGYWTAYRRFDFFTFQFLSVRPMKGKPRENVV